MPQIGKSNREEGKSVKNNRPVNLALTKFHFPRMAIVSILHRITGVIIFLYLPVLLWLFQQSLTSADSFNSLQQLLHNPISKILLWVLLTSVMFHLLAGIRHMIMDLGFAESLKAGRATATIVLILAVILFILLGVWIW